MNTYKVVARTDRKVTIVADKLLIQDDGSVAVFYKDVLESTEVVAMVPTEVIAYVLRSDAEPGTGESEE